MVVLTVAVRVAVVAAAVHLLRYPLIPLVKWNVFSHCSLVKCLYVHFMMTGTAAVIEIAGAEGTAAAGTAEFVSLDTQSQKEKESAKILLKYLINCQSISRCGPLV